MATFRVTYAEQHVIGKFEDVEADHMYAADWCVVFCDERDNPVKIIHANAVHAVQMKPQTH